MAENIKAHDRARDILLILKSNGPLPTGTIRKLIEPPIRKRRLRDSLARLTKKGFVQRRYEQIFGPEFPFYQIAQKPERREKVATYIDCPPEELRQAYFSHREVIFNSRSSMLTKELKKLFPEATCIRNFELEASPEAKRILPISDDRGVFLPDILMIFPSREHSGEVQIAFEIEKYRKTEKRLTMKLRKYAEHSQLDGVVYLCEPLRILEIVQQGSLPRMLSRVARVKRYGNNFLTFSNSLSTQLSTKTLLINAKGQSCSLMDWTMFIRSSKDEAMPGGSG